MNSIDFLKELNEIDDELLMNAELPPKRKPYIYKIGVNAMAVILILLCLMPVTVVAVVITVRTQVSKEEFPNYEDYLMGGLISIDSKVTTIEYELSTHNIEIPQQWEEKLTDAWKAFPYTYDNFTGIDLKDIEGKRINFGGIKQIEELLEISLTDSKELERITLGAYVTLVITDQERAAVQFRTEGTVTPDGVLVYLPFSNDEENGLCPDTVDYLGLQIFIPLTEPFVDKYAEYCVMSGVNKQDLNKSSFFSSGNIEIILLENSWQEKYDAPRAYAAWEQGGIGYLVELKCTMDMKASPGELIRPYLEKLEERE